MIRKNNLGEIADQIRPNCKPKSPNLKNNFAQIGRLSITYNMIDAALLHDALLSQNCHQYEKLTIFFI